MYKAKVIIAVCILIVGLFGYFIGKNISRVSPPANTQISLPYEQVKVVGVDSTKQKQIEDFIDLFYYHKQLKDVDNLLGLFTQPKTNEEQDDLDFVLGKDIENDPKPLSRLFSTQGYRHTTSGYFIRDISLVGGDIKVSVDELRTFYSGMEYVGYTAQVSNLMLDIAQTSDGFKIARYYHKDLQDTPDKYEGFVAR